MKLKATHKNGKVHLTVGQTTYALKPADAAKLANQIGRAASEAVPSWDNHINTLQNLMQDIYKKP